MIRREFDPAALDTPFPFLGSRIVTLTRVICSCLVHSGTGYCQGGEQRKTFQVVFGNGMAEKNWFRTLWNAEHKRFKSFVQHGSVFFAVVAKPSFPKGEGAYAVIWDCRFAIRDDVFDVLTRS